MTNDDVQANSARLDAHSDRLETLEEQCAYLEAELKKRDERIDELEQQLEAVGEQTELLDSIVEGSSSARQKRAGRIVQSLYIDASPDGSASMDARAGWENLNRTVDRTALYGIFQAAVDAIDDEDVCYIEEEPRHSKKNTRLVLDLRDGEAPATVGEVPVSEVGD